MVVKKSVNQEANVKKAKTVEKKANVPGDKMSVKKSVKTSVTPAKNESGSARKISIAAPEKGVKKTALTTGKKAVSRPKPAAVSKTKKVKAEKEIETKEKTSVKKTSLKSESKAPEKNKNSKTLPSTLKATKKSNSGPKKSLHAKVSASSENKKRENPAQKSAVKKTAVKTPVNTMSATSVTSAEVENLYGKHYIINTSQDLPQSYGKNRLITLIRDPEWIYAFWDVADDKINEVKNIVGNEDFFKSKRILRVYDAAAAGKYSDIELTKTASSWYIHVKPEASYSLELGYLTPKGNFVKLAESNKIETPRQSMSEVKDEKWMVKDGVFEKIYELSGGTQLGMSSADIMQAMARGMRPEEFSELITKGISSETLSSQFSMEKKREEEDIKRQRKFWMVLNTEIIVYGATEPDASVTLMGKPIKLRQDGTFSIRMALPDSDIDIPAVGVSSDKVDEIIITPCVHKHTNYNKKENSF